MSKTTEETMAADLANIRSMLASRLTDCSPELVSIRAEIAGIKQELSDIRKLLQQLVDKDE